MAHTMKDQKNLLTRVRKIIGQSTALENALEGDHDCTAVLQQIAAIKGAVNGLMKEVLEEHMRAHLGAGAKDLTLQQREDEVEQVISVLKSYLN